MARRLEAVRLERFADTTGTPESMAAIAAG
jgi:hypothetical protein